MNYSPFNIAASFWSSNTRPGTTAQAFYLTNNGAGISSIGKTNTFRALLVRTFTLAELGL
jgi:hypothetical protein